MMYQSPERSPQDSRDGFFLYSAQASFSRPRVDLALLIRRAYSYFKKRCRKKSKKPLSQDRKVIWDFYNDLGGVGVAASQVCP